MSEEVSVNTGALSSDVKLTRSCKNSRDHVAGGFRALHHLAPFIATAVLMGGCSGAPGGSTSSRAIVSQNPAPIPAPTPTVGSGPAPPSGTGLTSAACLSAVNGQQWPTSCRPYASTAPWNIALPDNPQQTSSFPTGLEDGGNAGFSQVWTANTSSNGGYPVFFAKSGDPSVTLWCNQSCASNLPNSIQLPANAQVAGGSDHHIAVIQPDGTEYDCWLAGIGGGSLSCAATGADNIVGGDGIEQPSTTSGNALVAGLIRSDEMQTALNTTDGYIPHVLAGKISCVSGSPVAPFGTSQAALCQSGTSLPIGARIQYTLTFSQIDALSATPYQKVILRTLHRYGITVEDTDDWPGNQAARDGFRTQWEDPTPYVVNGQAVPWSTIAPSMGWTYDAGTQTWSGPDPASADSDFAQHLVVTDPCYALGTCAI